MGRMVKMVPKDFDWPMGLVWEGYLNPYYKFVKQCSFCSGSGYNEETNKIRDLWYNFDDRENAWRNNITQDEVDALAKSGRLIDFTHRFVRGQGWVKKKPEQIPLAKDVNVWAKSGVGHDVVNMSICVETRARRLGVYGLCEHCNGDGNIWLDPKYENLCDEWEPTEPPSGNYYQMWEDVSEGSPMSPVFETPELLASWLASNGASAFGSQTATYEEWLAMIVDSGYAVCGVFRDGVIMSGVAALGGKQ